MKNYKLLLGSTVFAGVVLFSASNLIDSTPRYTPRKNQTVDFAKNALGAQQWLFEMQKNPLTGRIDLEDVLKSREEVAQFLKNNATSTRAAIGLQWEEMGPDNVGGRTRGILIDKNNPNKMFACSVAGGLFISTDGGSTWKKHDDQLPNMNLTCITQAVNGDIYIGTGEDLYNQIGQGYLGSGLLGAGIYKSTDGGATFTRLPSTIPATPNTTVSGPTNVFLGVNNLAADPFNSNKIYAATAYGLRMTTDGGTTWTHAITLSNGNALNTRCTDVDVASDGTVIAAVGQRLYISPNGDQGTYTSTGVGVGLPSPSALTRIEFAIAPSDPNYMYALSGKSSNGLLEGVYQSIDKGVNWTKIGNGGSTQFEIFGTGQAAYDNTLYVFPNDKTKIIAAGVSMWSWKQTSPSTPGIGQWTAAASLFQSPFNPFYVHADVHTMKPHPTNPSVFFVGTDGGVFRGMETTQNSAGFVYQPMNNGYNVTQFYSIAYHNLFSNKTGVMGGTQDNGTNFIPGNLNTSKEAVEVNGGDGAECEFSYLNPNASFTATYYGNISRHSTLGGTPLGVFNSRILGLSGFGAGGSFASFVTPMALYETKTATNSVDSVTIINGPQSQVFAITNGSTKRYWGFLAFPYPSATAVPDSIKITCDGQTITDDGAGNLIGNVDPLGQNSINYSNGYFDFTFATTPATTKQIVIDFDVKYNVGSSFTFVRPQFVDPLTVTTSVQINPGDTVRFHDPYQSKLAVGFTGNNGVWITKECLNFSKTPHWIKLGPINGTTEELAWSPDGNILYVGTTSGALYRFSNINAVVDSANADYNLQTDQVLDTTQTPPVMIPDTTTNSVVDIKQIAGFGRTITGISVDPNDPSKVAVSLGGYGQTLHVYYSTTAATCPAATNASNFASKQGTGTTKLPAMPVYNLIIEKNDPKRVIIATEYGIYSTEDITVSNPVWSAENGSGAGAFPNVATYDIRQQRLDGTQAVNPFVIYAGTHGRGIWKSESLIGPVSVGVNEPWNNNVSSKFQTSLKVYPNPMQDFGTVSFDLAEANNIVVSVYNLQGKLVKTINTGRLQSGNHKVIINSQDLSKGAYLISVDGTNVHATSRFVVIR